MKDLRKEIVKMDREIATLRQVTESTGVDGAAIYALDERMIMLEIKMEPLTSENERTKCELKNLNEIKESQSVVHNGVHLTASEAIHRILVRVNYLETINVDEQTGLILEASKREPSAHINTEDE